MSFLAAHVLDRANEWLVYWRLSGRLPPHSGNSIVEHLGALGDAVHPSPGSLPCLRPVYREHAEWRAASPWPGAEGRNAHWYAERFVGRGARRGVDSPPTGAAVILLPGWLVDRPQLLIYRSWARQAAARGMDVWMPTLPYHLQRAEAGEVSGQRALSPELSTSLDAVRQAVAETRLLAGWLRRNGASSVGVWGMSLGAWVAALAVTLDADWDAVALWAPVASPAEVLFESRLMQLLRAAVVEGGLSPEDLVAPEMALMTPARRTGLVPRSKVLIIAGVYDQVVSPLSIVRMARRWNVDVRWVPHGHISLMVSRAPIRDTVDFFEKTLSRRPDFSIR